MHRALALLPPVFSTIAGAVKLCVLNSLHWVTGSGARRSPRVPWRGAAC